MQFFFSRKPQLFYEIDLSFSHLYYCIDSRTVESPKTQYIQVKVILNAIINPSGPA